MEEDEKTLCDECDEIEVTTKFNTIDKWISTCGNCGDTQSYP